MRNYFFLLDFCSWGRAGWLLQGLWYWNPSSRFRWDGSQLWRQRDGDQAVWIWRYSPLNNPSQQPNTVTVCLFYICLRCFIETTKEMIRVLLTTVQQVLLTDALLGWCIITRLTGHYMQCLDLSDIRFKLRNFKCLLSFAWKTLAWNFKRKFCTSCV